jgi:hypothetical protein
MKYEKIVKYAKFYLIDLYYFHLDKNNISRVLEIMQEIFELDIKLYKDLLYEADEEVIDIICKHVCTIENVDKIIHDSAMEYMDLLSEYHKQLLH